MFRRAWIARALILTSATAFLFHSPSPAASWADQLFHEQGHDFGPVPRGAKVRHNFILTNRSDQPLTILNVRASCGCTTGRAASNIVQPNQSTTIEAEMDTRNFVGRKATVLFVTVINSAGREAEARLNVASTILSDIVLNPGTLDFGVVARGKTPAQSLTIDRIGPPGWQIKRMISTSKSIDATLSETHRDDQSVSYLLKVSIRADAPPGPIRDEIRLLTNDPQSPAFPVQFTANIRGDLSASPSLLSLGKLASAEGLEGRFLVRSSLPFTIKAIQGDSEGFTASIDDATPKPLHFVTVRFRPDQTSPRGDLRHAFRLHSSLPGELPLDLTVTLQNNP